MGFIAGVAASIKRKRKKELQALTKSFGKSASTGGLVRLSGRGVISPRQFKAGVSQQRNVGAATAASIVATQKAVSFIAKDQDISEESAATILRSTSRSIKITQASLRGVASGIQKRISQGKSGSLDITRISLARKLGTSQPDDAIVQHVINVEIAKPETLLTLTNHRRVIATNRKNLTQMLQLSGQTRRQPQGATAPRSSSSPPGRRGGARPLSPLKSRVGGSSASSCARSRS